jgi:nucleotide-binding universal stress UspA family protein
MRTILVPNDFSATASNALNYAASLARAYKARLLIVHVVNIVVIPVRSGKLVSPSQETDMHYYVELNKIASALRTRENIACEVEVIDQFGLGSFQKALNQSIKARNVDLVVMGTKGATNFLDELLGTNTSEFIKVAVCPVLVIPPGVQYSPLKHLAYASDFGNDETPFLHQLARFVESFLPQASISILEVMSGRDQGVAGEAQPRQDVSTIFPQTSCHFVQLNESDVLAGVQSFVHHHQVDALVVSINVRSFLEGFLQTSIGKQLVYHGTFPLLTITQPSE